MSKKVILSDIGNVVVDFDNYLICKAIARYSKYHYYYIYRFLFCGPVRLTHDYTRGLITTKEFRELVLKRFGCQGVMPPEEFDRAFARVFTANRPVVLLWHKLMSAGVKIVAVSDLEELRHRELERIGIMSLFNHTVLSYEEHIAKPDEQMFRLALARAGAEPSEAVFIDDIFDNVDEAWFLGIKSHHYQDFSGLVEFLRQQGFNC